MRIITALSYFLVIITLQLIINSYFFANIDLFGLTLLMILIIFARPSLISTVILSVFADLIGGGGYYIGTHLLLFTIFMVLINNYITYLKLCALKTKIISLTILSCCYCFALNLSSLLLQHLPINLQSLWLTLLIMPIILYMLIKRSAVWSVR